MQFQYVAYTLESGVIKGRLDAEDEQEARAALEERGYKTLRVSPPPRIRLDKLPITLETLSAEGTSRPMRKILSSIHERVSAGDSFVSALRQHPDTFDDIFISLVEVGEYTGKLAGALRELADMMQQMHDAKKKAKKAMIMPAFLVLMSIGMLTFMTTAVLPPLVATFQDMDIEVPWYTVMLVNWKNVILRNIVPIGGTILAVLVIYKGLQRNPGMKYRIHLGKAKIPVMGGVILAAELGTFSRVMTSLIRSGVDLPTSLRLGISSTNNEAVRQAWIDAEESLMSGHRMAAALVKHPILPQMFVELMAIGEDSNTLSSTMSELADSYQRQFQERVEAMVGLVEPVATLAVGGVVLLLMLSVMQPILGAMNQFGF